MTRQEILNLPHLRISQIVEGKFVHIHTEKGYFITTYKEGDDVKDYYGTECIYFPIREEYDFHRVITIEEHTSLEELREKAIEDDRHNTTT